MTCRQVVAVVLTSIIIPCGTLALGGESSADLLSRMQGTWFTRRPNPGKGARVSDGQDITLTVAGNRWVVTEGTNKQLGVVSVDASTTPASLDLKLDPGQRETVTEHVRGVVEITADDKLRMVIGDKDDRPTSFAWGPHVKLLEFKRPTAGASRPPATTRP